MEVKSRSTSCFFYVFNNTLEYWLFYFLVFWLRWGKKITIKIFSQVSMHVAFLPLPLLGTVDISTVGIFTNSNSLVAGAFFGRHMKSILVPSLPLRVYLWGQHITLSRELLWQALVVNNHTSGCVSCLLGKICKIWHMPGWYCTYLSSTSWIYCLFESKVPKVLEVMVIPTNSSVL